MTPLHLMMASSLQTTPTSVTSSANFAQLTLALSELSNKSARESSSQRSGPLRDTVSGTRVCEEDGFVDEEAEDVFLGKASRCAVSRSNFLPRLNILATYELFVENPSLLVRK